ncbi:phenylacetate--CoA ligase family protein [Candidatus Kaiserbacteria bacterium]|nr:phenylacetate--CoA ligase family protein [Candidatus Kaiserbacteria bacterium]
MSKTKSAIPPSVLVKPVARGMAERVRTTESSTWMRLRARNSLALFHDVAKRVPAYRNFLKEHGIHAEKIHSREDFEKIPVTSKASYLKKYKFSDLCWDGILGRPAVFSSTSGSTGKPFYFQRLSNLEEEYSILAELFLGNGANVPGVTCPTLVIIGFGMGVWIGGTLTYRAFDIASRRAYPVSILPAGVNKAEILKALHDLAPSFKQTIIIGYPPFVKDILDEAEFEGVDLKALNIRLLFAAEAFSEHFRDYLAKKVDMKNVYRDTLNIYGTADIGAMAFETPTAILIRRLAMKNKKIFARIFGDVQKTPTLAQYNPAFVSFEAPEGEILLTGYSAVPLVRYAVGDRGGVHTYDELKAIFAEFGINIEKETKRLDVPLYELPFVYVYERSDLATTLYGLQIYPEYLRDVMMSDFVQRYCTGKFQTMTRYDDKENQYLEINIEQKRGIDSVSETFIRKMEVTIKAALKEKSSEFRELSTFVNGRPLFKLVFRALGDPEYFPSGIKQKWVRK